MSEQDRDPSGGVPQPPQPQQQPGPQGEPWRPPAPPQPPSQPQSPAAPVQPPLAAPPQPPQPHFGAPQTPPFGAQGAQPPPGPGAPQPSWGTAGPAGPSGPAGPPPPRRGLPVGAWIGIAAGAVVLIAAIAVTVVFVIGAAGAVVSSVVQERPTTTRSTPPLEDNEGNGGNEDDDADSDDPAVGGSGALLIDGVADFAVGPYWEVGFDAGWQIDSFDVGGENRFSHPASGCRFFSYQGFGGFASASDGDRLASERTLESAVRGGLGLEWQPAGSPSIVFDRAVMLEAYGYDGVEMLRYVSDYVHAEGGDRRRVFLIRNFQPSDAVLYAMTDCPASASGVGAEFLETLRVNDAF